MIPQNLMTILIALLLSLHWMTLKKLYPQIDKPFRCINIYSRKASIALWYTPLRSKSPILSEISSFHSLGAENGPMTSFILT